jgi:DNA-binding IclR family transcriptional regulator
MAERLTDAERTLHELLPFAGSDGTDAVWRAVAQAAELFGDRDYVREELEALRRCSVSVMTAPAFDADGGPDLWLSAYVMQPSVTVSRVRALGARLRQAADAVTASVGGYDPWSRSA